MAEHDPEKGTTINAAAVWFKFSPPQLIAIAATLAGAVLAWVTINQNIDNVAKRLDGSGDFPGIVGRLSSVETGLLSQSKQYDVCMKEISELRVELRNQSEAFRIKSEDMSKNFELILRSIETELKKRPR